MHNCTAAKQQTHVRQHFMLNSYTLKWVPWEVSCLLTLDPHLCWNYRAEIERRFEILIDYLFRSSQNVPTFENFQWQLMLVHNKDCRCSLHEQLPERNIMLIAFWISLYVGKSYHMKHKQLLVFNGVRRRGQNWIIARINLALKIFTRCMKSFSIAALGEI